MEEIQLALEGLAPDADASVVLLHAHVAQFRDLTRFCRHQSAAIARRAKADPRSDGFLFAQAVKLGEEVGELHAEILGYTRNQRESKLSNFSKDSVGAELADVLICVGILADVIGVDLGHAVQAKMDAITARRSSEPATTGSSHLRTGL